MNVNGYLYNDEDNEPMNEEAWQAARAEIRTPDAQMPFGDPPKPNCHDYCRFHKICRYDKGSPGRDPDECRTFIKLEDIENDLPFTDPDEPDESEWEDDYGEI